MLYLIQKEVRGTMTTFDVADNARAAEAKRRYEAGFCKCYVAIIAVDAI